MLNLIDKNLLIAVLEKAIDYVHLRAEITTLDDVETALAALRAAYDADPDTVSEDDIEDVMLLLENARFPSLKYLSWAFPFWFKPPASYESLLHWLRENFVDVVGGRGVKYITRHRVHSPWSVISGTFPENIIAAQSAIIGAYLYTFGSSFITKGRAIYRAPLTNPLSWTALFDILPEQIRKAQLAIIGEYIYLFGGVSSNRIHRAALTTPETWTTLTGTLPEAVSEAQCAIIGEYIYLFGGWGGSDRIHRAPLTNPETWVTLADTLPEAVNGAQLAIIGEYIYLFGGWASDRIHRAPLTTPETWTTLTGKLPSPLSYAQLAILGPNIYLLGGNIGDTPTTVVYQASRKEPDKWQNLSWTNPEYSLPGAVANAQICRIGDMLYVFGGSSASIMYALPLHQEQTFLVEENGTYYDVSLNQPMSTQEYQENIPWKIG